MKREHLPLYAIALAVLIVGLALAGVPMTTVLIGLAVLACPLMMMFMMGGGHGGGSDQHTGPLGEQDRDHRRGAGRP